MKFFRAVCLGVRRHPVKFFAYAIGTYSFAWTMIESAPSMLDLAPISGKLYYIGLIIFSLVAAFFGAYPPTSATLKVGHSNTRINVSFGDVFAHEGYVAVPVNEFFDSEIGKPVSPKSLHGIVIERFYGGHPQSFDQLVTRELEGIPFVEVARSGGKSAQYQIGTCAHIDTSERNFILFAMCTTELDTFKARSTLPNFVKAIEGLCAKARVVLGGNKLILPLAGSGLAGLGLKPQSLLQLILIILANQSKKDQFALEIEVVVQPERYAEIDLQSIINGWE